MLPQLWTRNINTFFRLNTILIKISDTKQSIIYLKEAGVSLPFMLLDLEILSREPCLEILAPALSRPPLSCWIWFCSWPGVGDLLVFLRFIPPYWPLREAFCGTVGGDTTLDRGRLTGDMTEGLDDACGTGGGCGGADTVVPLPLNVVCGELLAGANWLAGWL